MPMSSCPRVITLLRLLLVAAMVATLSTCGGGNSSKGPAAPSPPPPTTPPVPPVNPNRWSITGRVVETLTNAPVPGATLDLEGFGPIQADGSGAFRFESTTVPTFSPYRVTVTSAGYVPRDARVLWRREDRTDVTIDVIRDAPLFSLTFYRQLVRNGHEEPGNLRRLRRWSEPPNFYVRTVDETTGRSVEPEVLALVQEWLLRAVRMWTGWSARLESGTTSREDAPGWIRVVFVRTTENFCGRAFVGGNPGVITLNDDRCNCGSRKVPPSTVVHEVGHALGFWHVADRDNVMYRQDPGGCHPSEVSGAERHHAAIAYRRPNGSRDIDTDPETPGFLGSQILVVD